MIYNSFPNARHVVVPNPYASGPISALKVQASLAGHRCSRNSQLGTHRALLLRPLPRRPDPQDLRLGEGHARGRNTRDRLLPDADGEGVPACCCEATRSPDKMRTEIMKQFVD